MGKKDNRGMSLVELIIVMAIMAVIVGMTGFGLSLVSNKPVDECAKKIEMVLNRNRTNSMGKKDAYVEFYLNSDNRVTVRERMWDAYGNDLSTQEVTIGADGVKVRMYFKDGSYHDLNGTPNIIAFRRDSGSLSDAHGMICTKIEVYKGDYASATHKQTIELEELTGKVTLK